MAKEIKYQTELIEYGSGQNAGSYDRQFPLYNDYERCIGIAVFPIAKGGVNHFDISLEDQSKTYIDPVHYSMLESSPTAGLETEKRFLKVNIPAGGTKVKVITHIPTSLTSDLKYQVVFMLEKEVKA